MEKTAQRCVPRTRTRMGPSASSPQALNYAHRVVRSTFTLTLPLHLSLSPSLSIHLPLYLISLYYLTVLQMYTSLYLRESNEF